MTASIRYAPLRNTAGEAISLDQVYSEDGKDFGLKIFRRTFADADIGTDPGQTRHVNGCPLLSVSGAVIKEVISFQVFSPGSGDGNVGWMLLPMGTATARTRSAYRNNSQGGLYFKDYADGETTRVVAGDFVVFGVLIGNY